MSSHNIKQVRVIARQLAARAKTDPIFKEQIQKDPVGTLTTAGLPQEFVPDFLRETQLGDVSGYIGQIGCSLTVI